MCVLIWFVWCMYFIQDVRVIITGVTLQRLVLSIYSRKTNSLVMLFCYSVMQVMLYQLLSL